MKKCQPQNHYSNIRITSLCKCFFHQGSTFSISECEHVIITHYYASLISVVLFLCAGVERCSRLGSIWQGDEFHCLLEYASCFPSKWNTLPKAHSNWACFCFSFSGILERFFLSMVYEACRYNLHIIYCVCTVHTQTVTSYLWPRHLF